MKIHICNLCGKPNQRTDICRDCYLGSQYACKVNCVKCNSVSKIFLSQEVGKEIQFYSTYCRRCKKIKWYLKGGVKRIYNSQNLAIRKLKENKWVN